MRTEAYLRVLSDEDTVRELHRETNVAGAVIRELKAPQGAGRFWWNWATPRVVLDDVDAGVKRLLREYLPVLACTEKHRSSGADFYLELVSYCREGEGPGEGLYLSVESISLLNQIGAALDHDVVWDVGDTVKTH